MDEQHKTDVEQARAKLQEVQQTREARNDPRRQAEETPKTLATRKPADMEVGERGIKPVQAKPKKKKFSQRLKEALFSEDIGNGSVTEYAFFKIIIPAVKKTVSDALNSMINMALGLDPRTRTVGSSANPHTANASLYRDRNYNRPQDTYDRRDAVSEYEWDEATANDIYNQIREQIERYGEVSLDIVYSIMGMSDKVRTTDRHWGWTSMNGIRVVPLDPHCERNIIDMPSARALNR